MKTGTEVCGENFEGLYRNYDTLLFRRVRCEYFGIELVRVYIDSKIDEQERRALTYRWEETTWNGLQEGFA